jgi:hypothetical protein
MYRDLQNAMRSEGFHPEFHSDEFAYDLPAGTYFSVANISLKQAMAKVRKAVNKGDGRFLRTPKAIGTKKYKRKYDQASILVVQVDDFEWNGLRRRRRSKSNQDTTQRPESK